MRCATGILVLAALSVAGCGTASAPSASAKPVASLSLASDAALRQRCAGADWRATGFRHGAGGLPQSSLAQLEDQCGRVGVRVDRLSYATGKLEGLARFCTEANGRQIAAAGHRIENPCPSSLSEAFLRGYTGLSG